MTQTPPPGWFPDPGQPVPSAGQAGPPRLRYWDGTGWTQHVHAAPPAVMPQPIPTTPDGVPLAGWLPRAGALLLDALILLPVTTLLALPLWIDYFQAMFTSFDTMSDPARQPDPFAGFRVYTVAWKSIAAIVLIGLAVTLTYHALFLRRKGATPGKMVVGLRVRLRERPGQLPWSAVWKRLFVQNVTVPFSAVPFAGMVVGWFAWLNVLWPLWDSENQALHDKLARTNVVRAPR